MIKSIILSLVIFGGAFAFSNMYVGYPRIGPKYVEKQQSMRRSIRAGSVIYGSHRSGSFRTGK